MEKSSPDRWTEQKRNKTLEPGGKVTAFPKKRKTTEENERHYLLHSERTRQEKAAIAFSLKKDDKKVAQEGRGEI